MAQLSHPNVVSVYDVELDCEGVVLVMEYVEGGTLRSWLKKPRSWREILDAFIDAGRGLAAAHEAGVLHRDFKPSNVLVGTDGRIRVMDFGLARLETRGCPPRLAEIADESSSSLLEGITVELTAGGAVMGTPAFMAPEQHEGLPLHAAADQYAFCVALWLAIAGSYPFGQPGELLPEAKRAGPPRWPRDVRVPRALVTAVRRGLAPVADHRWSSMDALLRVLADVRRPASRRWRGLGFVTAVAVTSSAAAGFLGEPTEQCAGASDELVEAWGDTRRNAAEAAMLATKLPYSRDLWLATETKLAAYSQEWIAMHRDSCEASTVRGEQSPALMDMRMACLHGAKVQLAATTRLLAEADPEVMGNVPDLLASLPDLQRCARIDALQAEVMPPDAEDAEEVHAVRSELARARALREAAKYDDSAAVVEGVVARTAALEYGPLQTELALAAGHAYEELGAYERSEGEFERAMQSALEFRQWDEALEAATELVFVVGSKLGRSDGGLAYAATARGLLARSSSPVTAEARILTKLGPVYKAQGKYVEAETELRAAVKLLATTYAPEHPHLLTARSNLANALSSQGRFAESEAEHRAVLALRESTLGPSHPQVAESRTNLGTVLSKLGRPVEAEIEHRIALWIWSGSFGDEHPSVITSRSNIATVLGSQGRYAEAEAEHRTVIALWEATLGPAHRGLAVSRNNLSTVLEKQKRFVEAEAEQRAALDILKRLLGAEHPEVAMAHNNLGSVLSSQGRIEEAEREHRIALEVAEKVLGRRHPNLAASQHNLGYVLMERKRYADALVLLEESWSTRSTAPVSGTERALTAFTLARALWETRGDRARARALAETARDIELAGGPRRAKQLAKVEAWLRQHPAVRAN
jgi:tetratricopeptide (TPR) repeat protein